MSWHGSHGVSEWRRAARPAGAALPVGEGPGLLSAALQRARLAAAALAALALGAGGAAAPSASAHASGAGGPTEPAAPVGPQEARTLQLDEHTSERVAFPKNVERWAIGSPDILGVETLTSRELLVRGKKPGRTNLLVWFEDGELARLDVLVRRDLSILEAALRDVHPAIQVAMAPDREAVILSGTVPLAVYARRAELVAGAYLDAARPSADFLVGEAAEDVAEQQSAAAPRRRAARRGSVINLIRVEGVPIAALGRSAEEKLREAIAPIGGERVSVRRIVRGDGPDDTTDVLVLEGTVRDQITLMRVLSLAYKTYIGAVKGPDVTITDGVAQTTTIYEGRNLELGDDIKVIGDESGALFQQRDSRSGTSGLLRGFGSGSQTGGGTSGVRSAGLDNHVSANIARAKALELAEGRILSFIEVEDIPQVRVDIRIYEVNRSALLSWEGDVGYIQSDFAQGSLEPAGGATLLQGTQASRVGGTGSTDVQNVFGFLSGSFTNQTQVAGSKWAVDALISLLEQEGIARGLANTSLAVLSGEVGLFEVGGRIPISSSLLTQVPGAAGILSSVQFIEFGVNLAVRPLVGENGYITLDFVPEISTPDAALTRLLVEATGAPPGSFAFESRLLRTSARLEDGATLLVGGLNQTNRSDTSNYTPWLAKVPLLGLLFKGFQYSDDDLQVVVMVRPTIVRDPVPEAALWIFPETSELLERSLPRKRYREAAEREAEELRAAKALAEEEAAAAGAAGAGEPEVH